MIKFPFVEIGTISFFLGVKHYVLTFHVMPLLDLSQTESFEVSS